MKERSTSKLLERVISGICVFAMIFSMGVLQAFSVSAEVEEPQNVEPCACNTVFDFDYTDFTNLTGNASSDVRYQADEDSDKDNVVVVDTTKMASPGAYLNKLQFYAGSSYLGTALTADEVIQDGEYHLYKRSFRLSASSYTNLALQNNWPRSATILNELVAAGLQGKTLDFYFSIKVEGDMTKLPIYYIERIFVVDPEAATYVNNNDATCTKQGTISITCNTCNKEIIVSRGAFGEHTFENNRASEAKVSDATCTEAATYKAQCDNCDFVHESLTATVGEAKGHSFTTYVDNGNGTKTAICDNGCGAEDTRMEYLRPEDYVCDHFVFDFDYTDFTNLTGNASSDVRYQVDEDSDKDNVVVVDTTKMASPGAYFNKLQFYAGSSYLGTALTADEVIQDGEYHLYKRSFKLSASSYTNLALQNNWPRSATILNELVAAGLQGKTLDFYFSIKVEGDMTGADKNNLPIYYIERIFVVDPTAATYVNNNDATCTKQGTISITCNSCGLVTTDPNGTIGEHTEVVDAAVPATCTTTGLTEGKHCSVCEEVLVAQTVVDALGHKYSNDADTTCNVCGEERTVDAVVDQSLAEAMKQNDVKLESSLKLGFYFNEALVADAVDFYVVFTKTDSVVEANRNFTLTLTKEEIGNPTDAGLYCATFPQIYAAEIGDDVTAVLYIKDADGTLRCSPGDTSSILAYLTRMMPTYMTYAEYYPVYADYMSLFVELLNYGAAAQHYAEYKTDALVNANLTDEQKAYQLEGDFAPVNNRDYGADNDKREVSFFGTALSLEEVILNSIYVNTTNLKSGSVSDLRAEVRNQATGELLGTYTFKQLSGTYYYFNMAEILPKDITTIYTIQVFAGDTAVSNLATYSVESYIAVNYASYPALQPVFDAIMRYGAAANMLVAQ